LANTISAFFKLATLRSALFRLASSRFKSVVEMGKEKKDNPLPENEGVVPERIVELRRELKRGAGSGRGVLIMLGFFGGYSYRNLILKLLMVGIHDDVGRFCMQVSLQKGKIFWGV
jgi:hypothetical protein